MPDYICVDAEIRDYPRDSFLRSDRKGFSAASLGKNTPAATRARQQLFQSQLIEISRTLRTASIPVFLNIQGRLCRLDKGCIGHAVAAGFLLGPANGHEGVVEVVTLANPPQI